MSARPESAFMPRKLDNTFLVPHYYTIRLGWPNDATGANTSNLTLSGSFHGPPQPSPFLSYRLTTLLPNFGHRYWIPMGILAERGSDRDLEQETSW